VRNGAPRNVVKSCCVMTNCNDPVGCYLSRSSLTNPPQEEQCGKAVYTVLCTGPGVQRPEAPITSKKVLNGL